MAYTSLHEGFGGSHVETISANATAPAPTRQGGARLLVYDASSSGLSVTLPDATKLRTGGRLTYLVCLDPSSANSLEVKDNGGTTLVTLTAGDCVELFLAGNGSAAGTWIDRTTTYEEGTALASNRQHVRAEFGVSGNDVDLKTYVTDWGLWDGSSAVSLWVIVGELDGSAMVVGSTSTSTAAMTIQGFPAGSTCLLILRSGAYISGRGGNGGYGGQAPSGLLAENGHDGGVALSVSHDTVLFGGGFINGGGGGGGGGARNGNQAGGGGGGGAGYIPSAGGAAGSGGGASAGVGGQLTFAGGGGSGGNAGGTGGTVGNDGSAAASGGLGGSAGDAVQYLASVTWDTTNYNGTINGSETAV